MKHTQNWKSELCLDVLKWFLGNWISLHCSLSHKHHIVPCTRNFKYITSLSALNLCLLKTALLLNPVKDNLVYFLINPEKSMLLYISNNDFLRSSHVNTKYWTIFAFLIINFYQYKQKSGLCKDIRCCLWAKISSMS